MDRTDSKSRLDPSLENPRSPSKMMREKMSDMELGGRSESSRKRIKMRDLDSVFRSEGIETHHSKSSTNKEARDHAHLSKKEDASQISEGPVSTISTDRHQEVTTGHNNLALLGAAACLSLGPIDSTHSPLDRATEAHVTNSSTRDASSAHYKDVSKSYLPTKSERDCDTKIRALTGLEVDLNEEDASNMTDQDPFYPYKNLSCMKSREASECGSTTGPLEESESLRRWKAMKQNGFLSASHGGIPVVPKQRGQSRKSKNDSLKKKLELAKREQVNRFTKIAAPSGLLTGLNPGIINHVRNSKQVHSIIEALVRSEKLDGEMQSRSVSQSRRGNKENKDRRKDPESVHDLGAGQFGLSYDLNRLSIPSSFEQKGENSELDIEERRVHCEHLAGSHVSSGCEEETLTLKLSSAVTMASENTSCLSHKEFSANHESVTSLSIKAATVASQWLELLYQDIRGRIAALRRSKKRVRTMIQTELPSLMSREFSSSQENDPYFGQSLGDGCSNNATPDMHMARWRSLFDQMDKSLSEEAKHLEIWLKQVKEMQSHCERGLQLENIMGMDALQKLVSSEKLSRSSEADIEREFAVRAAAASIYSTSHLVMTTENVSCF